MKSFLRAISLAPDAQGQLLARQCRRLGYWVSTGVVASVMGYSGLVYLRDASEALEGLFALSYSSIVGLCQLLGSIVLLAPGSARLKRWTYVIFALLFTGEAFSALGSGETREAIALSIALGLLAFSFFLRRAKERR